MLTCVSGPGEDALQEKRLGLFFLRAVRFSHLTTLKVLPASAGQLMGGMATRQTIVGLYLFCFFDWELFFDELSRSFFWFGC